MGKHRRFQDTAAAFKALGDENRLKIIEMLKEKDMCVCEIMEKINLSQPAISHHLKLLRQAKIVADSKEGKWIYYSLNRETLQKLACSLAETACGMPERERTDRLTCEAWEQAQSVARENTGAS